MNDRRPTFDVPDQSAAPVVWDPQARAFVPDPAAPAPAPAEVPPSGPGPDPAGGRWFVGPDAVGKALPPRPGTPPSEAPAVGPTTAPAWPPSATTVAPDAASAPSAAPGLGPRPGAVPAAVAAAYAVPAPASPVAPAPPAAPPPPVVGHRVGAPPPAAPGPPAPAKARRRRRRKRIPFVPRLRWILAFFSLLPLLLVAAGYLYATAKFNGIERVAVGQVLDPLGGDGTNYLIVGSDSREGDNGDPNIQGDASELGQRSDTMLLLRIERDAAYVTSIPRDLWVTHLNGDEDRINAAYNANFIEGGGPAMLIQTIQSNLRVPIHRYLEVDFFTFSSLVDALGGITLGPEIVPHAAFDQASGLLIPQPGPVTLDGQQALAFVRSRHYVEVIDGEEVPDATGDLGRGLRQQAFLRAVMSKAGASRNPLTLLRVAGSVASGIRIDDRMSLVDGARFAWNMGRANPITVELPVVGTRREGKAVLDPGDGFDAALEQFR